jgi:hypothetical protein
MNHISLKAFSIARLLGAVACVLVLASIAGQLTVYLTGDGRVYGLVRLFYVDAERNIPTAFSSLLLLIAALLLACITVLKRKQPDSSVLHWAILSFGFAFMAADEALCFHERLTKPIRHLLGDHNLGIFSFAWVIPGIVLVLILGLFFFRFLLSLRARTRWTFLLAAVLYIGGAIGFELIGGRFAELYGTGNLTYSMIATGEESLEMAGVIVFIYALLIYIAENHKEVRFVFEGAYRGETKDVPESISDGGSDLIGQSPPSIR